MDKPKVSVVITALNLVDGETELRSKTYDKTNGLISLSVDGISNDAPYYGVISRAGTVIIRDKPEIIEDSEGNTSIGYWLQKQSDDNVLPDVSIGIYIDNCLQYSFESKNEISYTIQDRQVTINLSDSIEQFQDKNIGTDQVYSNTNAVAILNNIASIVGFPIRSDKNTTNYLNKIILPTNILLTNNQYPNPTVFYPTTPITIISSDTTYWDVFQQFAYAVRAIFFKLGTNYYFKRMKE